MAIEIVVVTLVMWLAAPLGGVGARRRLARHRPRCDEPPTPSPSPPRARPASKSSTRRILTLAIVALGAAYLVALFAGGALTTLTVNTINLALLLVGMLLHWTPARLMRAVREARPRPGASSCSSPSTPPSPA